MMFDQCVISWPGTALFDTLRHCILASLPDPVESPEVDLQDMADETAARVTYRDPQRFLEIYQRHYDKILNYLYRRTGCREVASDLASRTFIKALQWLQSREVANLRVKPWLYRIATTEHLQHTRSERRWFARVPLLGALMSEISDDPLKRVAETSEQELLVAVLHRLPEKYQAPLILRYYEELSFREIGTALGIAEASARSRVGRGLEKLQHEMEKNT